MVAVTAFGWAFAVGVGPITIVGLSGLWMNLALPLALGAGSVVALALLRLRRHR
jgi:hypothetical protein